MTAALLERPVSPPELPASSEQILQVSDYWLTGTLPILPFDSQDGFYGLISVDGQVAKVVALACDQNEIILLNLVGYDTSVSAAFAHIWQGKSVSLAPYEEKEFVWKGALTLQRLGSKYKQYAAPLPATKEVNCIALTVNAHIAEGILSPPEMPTRQQYSHLSDQPSEVSPHVPHPSPRYVLGNWRESFPHPRSFLAHLYAMRVILLHRASHTWLMQWAGELWHRGLARELITPCDAVGIRAWKVSPNVTLWNNLIQQGTEQGWLPWQVP
jgi:hypothetical protein